MPARIQTLRGRRFLGVISTNNGECNGSASDDFPVGSLVLVKGANNTKKSVMMKMLLDGVVRQDAGGPLPETGYKQSYSQRWSPWTLTSPDISHEDISWLGVFQSSLDGVQSNIKKIKYIIRYPMTRMSHRLAQVAII